jgi:replication factor C subunit 3/5
MALWVDKYRPRELSKLDYQKEQAGDLRRLCEQQDFPHLMFFGPSGSGKKVRNFWQIQQPGKLTFSTSH